MDLYKRKQKQNPTDGYEISENHWGEKEKMKQWEMKSWEKWNLLNKSRLQTITTSTKKKGQKAAEKGVRIKNFMFEQPIFPEANAHFKTPLELHFIYLCNKEIYCILRHATSSLFHFPQNATHFIILPSVQLIRFFHKPCTKIYIQTQLFKG